MIDIVIFSKDRALQLDCLIRSIKANISHFNSITVLFTTKHKKSYQKLFKKHSDVISVEETAFQNDFEDIVSKSGKYTALFVDDCIVFDKVNTIEIIDMFYDDIDIVSLRLGKNIKKKDHFNYKGSLDGNVFKTRDLCHLFEGHRFSNPNKLEIRLTRMLADHSMAWFNESKVIGIPANKVSKTSSCSEMGVDVDILNEYWNEGLVIDFDKMDFKHNNVHKNIDYAYTLEQSAEVLR